MKQKTPSVTLLVALFSLFFLALGIVGSMNDILNPFLKRMFSLSYRDAAWVHFSFYISYFLLSYASGVLAGRIGSKGVVITGLSLMLLGCQV
ncbi:MAG: glucose/galactose MFS transporter, partial [Bacteroidetes bacterium]